MKQYFVLCILTSCLADDYCSAENISKDISDVWSTDHQYPELLVDIDRCDIPIINVPKECIQFENLNSLKCRDAGMNKFLTPPSEPVIFRGLTDNFHFKKLTSKKALLDKYGDMNVILSTANQFSHDKVRSTFLVYVRNHVESPRPSLDYLQQKSASDVFYKFGDNYWTDLLREYSRPQWYNGSEGALSFGVGGTGSGVPFHIHGPVFAEVFYGRKRWFFAPSEAKPKFDGEQLSLLWFVDNINKSTGKLDLGDLSEKNSITTCTAQAGDTVYIPNQWWHGTLNVGETVFMSDFV